MSDPLHDLLDRAVAHVRPRAVDPVAAVVRRHRVRRRRLVAGCAAALATVIVAGVPLAPRLAESRPLRTPGPAVRVAPPAATPRIVGGEVVAGGLTVPIPAGWQATDHKVTYCDLPPRTIAVGFLPVPGGTGPHCSEKPYLVVLGAEVQSILAVGMLQVTLLGGQPAWTVGGGPDAAAGRRPGYNDVRFFLPWSGAEVAISLRSGDFARIVPSMRVWPVAPSRLALPAEADLVSLAGPVVYPKNEPSRLTGGASVAGVVNRRLARLADVGPNDQACATADMPTVTVAVGVVLVLRYWGGLSESEIAGQLGCSPGTVKSRASRAHAALRHLLGDVWTAKVT